MKQPIRWIHDGTAFAFDGLVLEARDVQGDFFLARGPELGITLRKLLAQPNGEQLAAAFAEQLLGRASRSRAGAILAERLRAAADRLQDDLEAFVERDMLADADEVVASVEGLTIDREFVIPEELS